MQTLPFLPEGTSPLPEIEVDVRSDEEIARTIREHTPPTDSNKNVWAYWRSGFDSMPPWTQRNVTNWVRLLRNSPKSWTVRILDSVPGSPNNVSTFIESRLLPKSFHEDSMTGPYAGAHSADLVRLPLLHRYGGVWIDAGTLLIRHLDDIWSIITDPANAFELVAMALPLRPDEHILVNPFLATKRGNEFVRRWHQIYLSLWSRGERDCTGFHAHPLLRHLPLFQPPPPADSAAPDIRRSPEAYTDYLAHMLCAVRLRDLLDPDAAFDGRRYYESRICLLPALRELYRFPLRNGWDGRREFAVLATAAVDSSSSSSSSPDADAARSIVCDALANSTAVKLSHGSRDSPVPWLAQLWSDPVHRGADVAPGSLAKYLRDAALRVRQTRALEPLRVAPVAAPTWTGGLLKVLVADGMGMCDGLLGR